MNAEVEFVAFVSRVTSGGSDGAFLVEEAGGVAGSKLPPAPCSKAGVVTDCCCPALVGNL